MKTNQKNAAETLAKIRETLGAPDGMGIIQTITYCKGTIYTAKHKDCFRLSSCGSFVMVKTRTRWTCISDCIRYGRLVPKRMEPVGIGSVG